LPDKAKKQKHDQLDILRKRAGIYMGHGINHENKKFKGDLELRNVVNNKGVSLKYKAVGTDGVEFNKETTLYNSETILYNEEWTLICSDSDNKLCLWTLNNNIGTMAKFDLRRYRHVSNKHQLFIFGYGEADDNAVFREEITIELWDNGDLSYNYSWGEAGGMFLSRSTIRMKKIGS
jgi:hypothetical protein